VFLAQLSPAARRHFAATARLLIALDGRLDAREEALFAASSREMGLPDVPAAAESTEAVLQGLDCLDTLDERRIFVLELIGLAVVDDDLHPAELDLVNAVATHLGLGGVYVARCLVLSQRLLALAEEARELVVGRV